MKLKVDYIYYAQESDFSPGYFFVVTAKTTHPFPMQSRILSSEDKSLIGDQTGWHEDVNFVTEIGHQDDYPEYFL